MSSSGSKKKSKKEKHQHPSYREMITNAIYDDGKWQKGSSRDSIKKYILANYDVDEKLLNTHLSRALRVMVETGEKDEYAYLEKVKASYRLTKEWRDDWRKENKKKSGSKSSKTSDTDSDSDSDESSRSARKRPVKTKRRKRRTVTKRKKKDPNAPTKPRTAWILYGQEVREGFRKRHPDLGFGDVTKRLAEKWKKLPSSEADRFHDMAAKDKRRYKREMAVYEATSSSSSDSDSESASSKSSKSSKGSKGKEKSHRKSSKDSKESTETKEGKEGSGKESNLKEDKESKREKSKSNKEDSSNSR